MDLTEINKREKKFHNDLQSKEKVRFENIFYKCLFNLYNDFDNYLSKNVKNKVVLDYGCGVGSITQKISTYKPSKIVGIDISEVSITKANANAKTLNLNIDSKVDNCKSSCGIFNFSFDAKYFPNSNLIINKHNMTFGPNPSDAIWHAVISLLRKHLDSGLCI